MQKHPHWILAVATLSQAIAIGVTIGIFPLMLEPLEANFSAPRTTISIGPLLIMLALCTGGVVAGGVLDKGRVRRAMLFGALLLSSSLALVWIGPNLWVLAVAALGAGFSIPFVGPLAGMTLVTRTFDQDQGRAFGIMSMGPGLGSGLFAVLGGVLLQSFDWRSIYLLLGGLTLCVLVPAIWLAIPAYLAPPLLEARDVAAGELPAGEVPASGAPQEAEVGIGDVMRRPVFWLSAAVFAFAAGIGSGWTSHYAAFLGGDVGMNTQAVASLVAMQFWAGVPGALSFGIMTDRFSVTKLFTVSLGLQAAIFVLYSTAISSGQAMGLGILFGFLTGGFVPLYMALLRTRLEPQILGRAMGISNILMLPAMAVTVMTAAALFESEGGYARTVVLLAGGLLLAVGSLFLSNRMARA